MNATIGLFEAKTRLSEICERVASEHVGVTITRRGAPLVRIEPIQEPSLTIRERRAAYLAGPGTTETDDTIDFEPAARSRERVTYRIEG
jgi:prevent-host-death family protein